MGLNNTHTSHNISTEIQLPSSCRLGLCSPAHSSLARRICWRTASTMGITMVTAEVFWTHIERKAQPDMKPRINLETEEDEKNEVRCQFLPKVIKYEHI